MVAPVEPIVVAQAIEVTIAVDASLSGVAKLGERRLLAIELPANTEGSALTFQGSFDGSTFYNVYDGSGEYAISFTDPSVLIVPAVDFLAFPYLKVRTGTAGTPTTQSGATATLRLIVG